MKIEEAMVYLLAKSQHGMKTEQIARELELRGLVSWRHFHITHNNQIGWRNELDIFDQADFLAGGELVNSILVIGFAEIDGGRQGVFREKADTIKVIQAILSQLSFRPHWWSPHYVQNV